MTNSVFGLEAKFKAFALLIAGLFLGIAYNFGSKLNQIDLASSREKLKRDFLRNNHNNSFEDNNDAETTDAKNLKNDPNTQADLTAAAPVAEYLPEAMREYEQNENNYDEKNSAPKFSPPRLFSVFSTECSPFHDWQAQTLMYNHKKQGIQGFLVRLLACDDPSYVLPKHSHENYRTVRMSNFGLRGEDNWR